MKTRVTLAKAVAMQRHRIEADVEVGSYFRHHATEDNPNPPLLLRVVNLNVDVESGYVSCPQSHRAVAVIYPAVTITVHTEA